MSKDKPKEGTTKERRIYLTYKAEYARVLSRPDALMHTASTWGMPIREIKPILLAEEAKARGLSMEEAIEMDRQRTAYYREEFERNHKETLEQDLKYYFL